MVTFCPEFWIEITRSRNNAIKIIWACVDLHYNVKSAYSFEKTLLLLCFCSRFCGVRIYRMWMLLWMLHKITCLLGSEIDMICFRDNEALCKKLRFSIQYLWCFDLAIYSKSFWQSELSDHINDSRFDILIKRQHATRVHEMYYDGNA